MSDEKVNELKSLGNGLLSSGDFDGAIKAYSDAIEIDSRNVVLYSNRSAAYAKANNFEGARADGEKCIQLNPEWAKGYSRLGTALHLLGKYNDAVDAFNRGLSVDPSNEALKEGLQGAEDAAREEEAGDMGLASIFSPENLAKVAADPKTAGLMTNPAVRAAIADMQANPKNMSNHLQNPAVMQLLSALLGINIQSFPGGGGAKDAADSGAFGYGNTPMPEQPSASAAKEEPKKEPEPEPEPEELTEEQMQKQEAQKKKDAGNAHYKKKEFEEALKMYREAQDLDPSNIVYKTNIAAVFMETKEFDKCVEICQEAIEEGRSNRADFKLIAKAYERMGNAYYKQQKYDDALSAYQKSLTEQRNDKVFRQMKKVEKEKEEAEKAAYFSEEKALEEKEAGNAAFKEQNFPKAIEHYTEALRRNPNEHTAYSNRAAAYMKMGAHPTALKDCDKCVSLNPEFVRGWVRKGTCHFYIKEYHKALEAYDAAIKLDKDNAEANDGLQRTLMAIRGASGDDAPDQERLQRAMADPEIQAIMSDPMMQSALQNMQTNPNAAAEYMRDPGFAAKMEKLIAAGVVRTG